MPKRLDLVMLLHNKIRALHVHLGGYFRTGLVGKQSWQIFPDFINELCREPPRDKRAKILAVNWTPGHGSKEMRSGAEFTKVSVCTDIACKYLPHFLGYGFCFVFALPRTRSNSEAGCLRLVAAGAVGLWEMTAEGL